jgi:hypothetical protein
MSLHIEGNTVYCSIPVGDSPTVTLPAGYRFEQIHVTGLKNIWGFAETGVAMNSVLIFPPINSKSPNYAELHILDEAKNAEIRFVIEKFGQIPDRHYFDKAFDPILITGEDGNEYNVIPSEQFK